MIARLKHFTELVFAKSQRPWCVVGKGPSFNPALLNQTDFPYNILALNQTCKYLAKPAASLFIDLEAFLDCPSEFYHPVLMPMYPHWEEVSQVRPLTEHLLFHSQLRRINKRGNLYAFDHSKGKQMHYSKNSLIIVETSVFEAALHILALLGQKTIYTNGVDGGPGRAKQFENSYQRNKRDNYSNQWPLVDRYVSRFELELKKL